MVAMVPITRLFAEGFGHSSQSPEGFLAAFVVLDP
jgi:hypothetical protein